MIIYWRLIELALEIMVLYLVGHPKGLTEIIVRIVCDAVFIIATEPETESPLFGQRKKIHL